MATRELSLELPLTVSDGEARVLFAVTLYEAGRISLGQAARLAGFSKRSFVDVLGQHHVPVFNYGADDLAEEIEP
jgi:predicted HTH domain antitoxin